MTADRFLYYNTAGFYSSENGGKSTTVSWKSMNNGSLFSKYERSVQTNRAQLQFELQFK